MSEDPWRSITGLSLGPGVVPVLSEALEGRYVRETLIGVGGMGRVYLAFDRRLHRWVALKEAVQSGPMDLALDREARITASLDHPGIVAVHDIGVGEDGRTYYAMRLVRGSSLEAVLDGPTTLEARLALLTHFRDACQALAYAHARGVIHRDVKPANLLVGPYGETQVVDWGLAVEVGTAPAETVGSAPWMAPEQARGTPADRRTDVFGLGAVLVHILHGRPPYPQPDGEEALQAARAGVLPVLGGDGLPAELVAIATKATRLDPEDRYGHAGELADDLERYLVGARVIAHSYTPWELFRRLVVAWRMPLLLIGGTGVTLAGLLLAHTRSLEGERNRAVAAEAEAQVALASALESQARSALADDGEGEAGVLAARVLQHGESPEARGAWLAHRSMWPVVQVEEQSLVGCAGGVLDATGWICRDPEGVRRVEQGRTVWTAPGVPLAVVASGPRVLMIEALRAIELDASTGMVLSIHARDVGGLPVLGTADGRFASRRWEGRSWSGALDPALAKQHQICGTHGLPRESTLHPTRDRFASWCADGTVAVELEDGTVHTWSTGRPVAEHGDASWLGFSPDGAQLAVGYFRGELLLLDVFTGAVRVAAARGQEGLQRLSWSPDGRLLSTVRDSGRVDIWSVVALEVVANLPVEEARDVRWDGPDRLRVLGSTVSTWAVSRQPSLPSRRHALGIRDLGWGEARLLTAHSDGVGVIWPLVGEGAGLELTFGRGTVMGLELLDGRVVGHAGETPTLRAFTLDGAPAWSTPMPTLYRGVLPQNDGSFVGLRYTSQLDRFDMQGALLPVDCPNQTWISGQDGWLVALDGTVVPLDNGVCGPALPGVRGSRLSRMGQSLLVAGPEGLQRLELDGRTLWTVGLDPEYALDLAASPDARWVAAAGLDHAIRVFRGDDGALVAVLRGHDKRVSAVAFSPDGQWLGSAGWDGVVRLWPVAALEEPIPGGLIPTGERPEAAR